MSTRSCHSTLSFCPRRLETFLQIALGNRIKDMHFPKRRISWDVAAVADASTVSKKVFAMNCKSGLDFEDFDDFVEADGKQAAKCWSKPVDPVVAWEVVGGDSCTKRASRVQRCACERTADQLSDEESQADAHGWRRL
jgi:hypothetical protein